MNENPIPPIRGVRDSGDFGSGRGGELIDPFCAGSKYLVSAIYVI